MSTNLPDQPEYKTTMQLLEEARHTSSGGAEFWRAREMQPILGYDEWRNFEAAIGRAYDSITTNGGDASRHFVDTTKMVGLGAGSQREVRDIFMSRLGCYLTAMNGDPSKPEIAAAQAYFVIQTRASEVDEKDGQDQERVRLRDKVTTTFKAVSGVAQAAGVSGPKQAIFHDARYLGLYEMSRREMLRSKGLSDQENPFDRMGALELSANDFQMNLAAETISSEEIKGEAAAIQKNKQIAQRVRKTMIESGAKPPELLQPAEPIKIVRKRLLPPRSPKKGTSSAS